MGVLVLAIFIVTRAGQHTFDALMFAGAINLNAFLPSVFRPHNMLYLPSAMGISRLISFITPFNGPTHAILVGQLWSALWGAVSAVLFFLLTRRLLRDWQAFLITFFFVSSYSIWFVSTEVEVYTMSLAATAGLYLSLFRRSPSLWIAGLLWGLAILGHITNILLVVPLFCYCVLIRRRSWWRDFAVLLAVGCGFAFLVYVYVGFLVVRTATVSEFINWVVAYVSSQKTFGLFQLNQFALGFLSLKHAFVAEQGKNFISVHVGVFLFAALLVLVRRGLMRRLGVVLFSHIITYSLFFSWWEPLNIEFWVVTLLPLCVLIGAGWRVAIRHGRQALFAVFLVLALLIQLIFNVRAIHLRMDPSRDFWMERGRKIAQAIHSQDLVITFNDPIVFTLSLAAGYYGGVSVDVLAGGTEADFNLALERLSSLIENTRRRGGEVYVTREGLAPGSIQLRRLSITREQYLQELRAVVGSELTQPVADGLIFR